MDRTEWLKRDVLASKREAGADTHLSGIDNGWPMGCVPTDLQDGKTVDDRASEYTAVGRSELSQQDPGSYNIIECKK